MHFEGVIEAPISPHDFYGFVTDPTRIISILPDVIESRVVDVRHFAIKSKVGMFYIRGTISMDFEITEIQKDTFVKMVGHGKGFQSSIGITMAITLHKNSEGTRATWITEAEVGGMLASLEKKTLNNVAENYVKQITETLKQMVTTQKGRQQHDKGSLAHRDLAVSKPRPSGRGTWEESSNAGPFRKMG